MITELIEIKFPYSIDLGPCAIEHACSLVIEKTGHFMNGYTLFVHSVQIGLVLKMMATMPRVGVQLDDSLRPTEWKLAGITPQMQIIVVHSEGY